MIVVDANTTPEVWPVCSEHGTAYVLRRCIVFGNESGYRWLWQRDCPKKCKAEPALANAEGRLS